MRPLVIGGLTMLAACTLLVPIDDDVSLGVHADGGPASDDGRDAKAIDNTATDGGHDAPLEAGEPDDSGEAFGPPRDGCPNGVALDPALDGYYPFDESGGGVLHDCSLKAHDLDALSSAIPAWGDGYIHGAADFNGNEGCFGSTDANLDRFENQPFSISVWVFPRQYYEAAKTGRWVVSHKVSPLGWHLGVDNPDRFELDLEWQSGGENRKTEISGHLLLSTWTHILTTYSETGEGSIYVNGVLAEKQSGPDKVPSAFGAGPNVLFRIGCRNAASGVFDGKIDELRIYPLVLGEDQIRKLSKAR